MKITSINKFFQKKTQGNQIFLPKMILSLKNKGLFWKLTNEKQFENCSDLLEDKYLEETKLDLFLRRFLLYDYNPHNVYK